MATDLRSQIVAWAQWCVAHKSWFRYLESRPFPLYEPTAARPISNDCSSTSVLLLWLSGAPEPFPGAYSGSGNTESFGALEHIPVSEVLPGDFVVYGLGLPLGDQHMATVVGMGSNPLTMSHGQPSEPAFVNAIQGCPAPAQGRITYVRCLPSPTPAPIPPPSFQEDDMICTDPTTGQVWGTDANGDFYAAGGSPFVQGLNQHPQYQAGEAESAGQNPCIGITPWLAPSTAPTAASQWGVCFVTKPVSGLGGFGPYSLYHFRRDGSPD